MFTIDVSLRTRVAPLSCCTRADCHWHGVPKRTRAKILAGAPRQKKPEQDPGLRVRNFQEVSYGYDSELAVAEASRCLQCKKRACVDGCPVGVDIPGFVKLVAAGDFADAARLIREKNALPAICGRVSRRTTSARSSACWAPRATRWRSERWSASPPTSSVRPSR